MMASQISGAVAVFIGAVNMKLETTQNYKYIMKFILGRGHMLYIHRNVCEGRGIYVYDPLVHWSIKLLMIFKCLTHMTTYNIHHYMIG